MSRIMLLTVGFQDSDANSICSKHIINGFVKNGDTVDLYCIKKSINDIDRETAFGNVFYFYNEYTKVSCFFEKRGKNISKMPTIQKYAVKILQHLRSIFYQKFENVYGDTIIKSALMRKVKEENVKEPYDIIIAVSQPFAYAMLAEKIKKKLKGNPKSYLYMLDPYVYNYTMSVKKMKKRQRQFKKYTDNVDGLIITRGVYEEAVRKKFDLHGRYIVVDLPNLVCKENVTGCNNYSDKTEILFGGWFYKDIRNPIKMLPILGQILSKNKDVIFTLYCRGCEDAVNKFVEKYPLNVDIKGIISHDEFEKYAEGANILLNLGNTIINQLPSKVFEYIASGKPIINFYFDERDTSLYYLKKYPLAFNLNLNNYTQSDVEGLAQFISENSSKRVSYNEATRNMPEARADNVISKIVHFVSEGEKNV